MYSRKNRDSRKNSLFRQYRALLDATLANMEAVVEEARVAMRVDGSHCPQNRGERAAVTSQGYLAHGMSQRLTTINEAIRLLSEVSTAHQDAVSVGALVSLEDEQGTPRRVIILPGGQGQRLDSPQGPVEVISPRAPLTRALRGLTEDDAIHLRGAEWTVLSVE